MSDLIPDPKADTHWSTDEVAFVSYPVHSFRAQIYSTQIEL